MRSKRIRQWLIWGTIALVGAAAFGGVALNRGESINAAWLVVAAACVYLLAYRFYSGWIAARVIALDATRATPAESLENGRDFMPTHRWIVFGHHFAAIAGAGPLVGPVLAAQMGYLPGTLWILGGVVFAGAVQDLTVLFLSSRRDGKTLGDMVRSEMGPVAGAIALIGVMLIMVILLAVLALVVVTVLGVAVAQTGWNDQLHHGFAQRLSMRHAKGRLGGRVEADQFVWGEVGGGVDILKGECDEAHSGCK